MTTFSDAVHALTTEAPVARADVLRWIESGDLLTWGAVYTLLTDAPSRVEPEFREDEVVDFTRRYLTRCVAENPNPGEYLHGGYEAAWELASSLKRWRRRGGRAAAAIRRVVVELAALFRRADAVTQNRVLCGLLEHAFEDPGVRPYFEPWQRDPELREIYKLAMEWGSTHEEG